VVVVVVAETHTGWRMHIDPNNHVR
jgi:hypothetical protein